MYIRATGNISPQITFGQAAFLTAPINYFGNRLQAVEPDYKTLIDAKLLRRMSRIIRMGVAAAINCLQEAGITQPGAIITGTAYGCMEDTGIFLTKMVENREELLTPTAFIQSTHNTIGAQIGLILQCNNYNNAFVHRGFSFESALLDAMLLLQENEVQDVLVGAIDEITDYSHHILSRMGLYKKLPGNSLELFTNQSNGTIAGEGAVFFLLANKPSATDYAKLSGLKTFYKPQGLATIERNILSFLKEQSLSLNDIDLIITGKNGNKSEDDIFVQLELGLFRQSILINYKQLCGTYPTAASFAVWLGANIIKRQNIPDVFKSKPPNNKEIRYVLIYDQYLSIHHTLILVASC